MSAKSILEADGKAILNYHLTRAPVIKETPLPRSSTHNPPPKLATIHFNEGDDVDGVLDAAESLYPWLKTEKVTGVLSNFLCEPFVAHAQDTEYYININSVREGDWILFTHEGGVDVGDVDAKAKKLLVPIDLKQFPSNAEIAATLLPNVSKGVHNVLVDFIVRLYSVYVDCQFTYLEINPLVVIPNKDNTSADVYFLDLAAKLDQTAEFECGSKWAVARSNTALGLAAPAVTGKVNIDAGPPIDFPAPYGREMSKEEAYIADLDAKTGASLKLTILNSKGRIWTLVAGGGASVVYADAIASAGFAGELANGGELDFTLFVGEICRMTTFPSTDRVSEYSGAPSEAQTYQYAKTVLDLMLRAPMSPEGKVLFIGGGIANFTNVASTFKGVIRALREVAPLLIEHRVQIWVRRAGPNYQEGLKNIKAVGTELGLDMHVYGPDMHVSGIVPLALNGRTSDVKEFVG